MPKKSAEEKEMEDFVRMAAEQAQGWQKEITANEDIAKWVADGNLDFLKRRIFDEFDRESFQSIRAPEFNPANTAQVWQIKSLCQATDLITAKIMDKVNRVRDARQKLKDLENSTQHIKEGE